MRTKFIQTISGFQDIVQDYWYNLQVDEEKETRMTRLLAGRQGYFVNKDYYCVVLFSISDTHGFCSAEQDEVY